MKKYITYKTAITRVWQNRKTDYTVTPPVRNSNTVYILGSGPSLAALSPIPNTDFIGINFSFLREDIIPTFHQFSWEMNFARDYLVKAFQPYRERYKDTTILLHTKAIRRLAHPLTTPEFFPYTPKIHVYKLPKYTDDKFEFDKSIWYRGTLSLMIWFAVKIGYKNILLSGVDLHTTSHFYDGMPHMREYIQKCYERDKHLNRTKWSSMYPLPRKTKPFSEYLSCLETYLEQKEVNLVYE